ncbi:SatD family protein [Sungkyunkwania multivorans]|uniref:SatD family protein n=1 Tax=Sungkyunkwania multivorans TaxID=1173618 RepID=A0ABW3CX66_9FLAO
MTSIITGDIINSRAALKGQDWLGKLKGVLSNYGSRPKDWDIYRGDSFQLEISVPSEVFLAAVHIKACIKTIAGLDVRIGIGIGAKDNDAERIAEANGSAFVNSGEAFDALENKRQNLLIKTSSADVDQALNTCFALTLLVMDQWTVNSAEAVKTYIENPLASQQVLGNSLGIKQNTMSERLKRSGIKEIHDFEQLVFRKELDNLLNP